jgi:hypothetical protein
MNWLKWINKREKIQENDGKLKGMTDLGIRLVPGWCLNHPTSTLKCLKALRSYKD